MRSDSGMEMDRSCDKRRFSFLIEVGRVGLSSLLRVLLGVVDDEPCCDC